MFIEEHVINGGNNSHHNYNFKHDYVVLFTGCLFACHWFLCLNQSLSILSWQSITRFILGCIWMGVYIFRRTNKGGIMPSNWFVILFIFIMSLPLSPLQYVCLFVAWASITEVAVEIGVINYDQEAKYLTLRD